MKSLTSIFNNYRTSEGVPFYLLSKSVSFPSNNDDIYGYMYVAENIPWTILSYQLYDTIDYWWVLSNLNSNSPFYAKKETNVKYIDKETLENILKYI